ncbi:MAG: hypothetical protein R3320_08515 [Nitriliruptorales bacterium]|nr:hypothetical protein [Nitriliruptorales bacterium]
MRSSADGIGRGVAVRVLEFLLLFLGVTAAGGGVAMLLGVGDGLLPDDWLADIPLIESWVAPGLVLFVGFGLGSLLVAHGIAHRPDWRILRWVDRMTGHHWAATGAVAVGVGQVTWICLELVYLPEISWLQPLYLGIGLAIAGLALSPPVRPYLVLPITIAHVPGARPDETSGQHSSASG